MNLTKKDLSAILKKELELSVDISDSLVDEFFQAIKTTLRSQKTLKLFLRENLYSHPKVREMTSQAHEIVSTLFLSLLENHKLMPLEHALSANQAHKEIGLNGSARIVADYVAGMTDRFALQFYEDLKK